VKLLFDHNLSYRLVRSLQRVYPDSQHVREVGLGKKTEKKTVSGTVF
jgi:predicted nuclease of predicted toxin-antitoxin system